MGTATALAPGLSRKLKKVLETRTDSPDLLSSLNTLSAFYTENSSNDRRNLRSTIEKRALFINQEFLQASDAAQQALDSVEEEVNALAERCDEIAKTLNSCSSRTGDIISTTERLKHELEITTQRQEIVSCFLRDYQLSIEEIHALREDDLSDFFFNALSHVQEIHANCKVLLRTHHQVANMRHNALFRRFISALTRGGPGGMPRPIEVHAHDPLRYVGDMLGYLHQALASERELVLALLDPEAISDIGPTARKFAKGGLEGDLGKTEIDLTFVLDRIFEGICRPFKVRVEQVLQSQPSIIISYKLSNTLEFYSYTISDLLGRDTALCNTLWALKDASQKTFFEILKTRGEKLLRYPALVAVDLSPPLAVREGVSLLLEIIETYDNMMFPASRKKPPFDPVISALLDPIIQMCEQAADGHKSKGGSFQSSRKIRTSSDPGQFTKSSVDDILTNSTSISSTSAQPRETLSKIFLVNCLCAIQQPILGREAASEYVKKLGGMIDGQIRSLVREEVDAILSKCGLLNKMSFFNNSSDDTESPLVEIEDTSPESMSDCLKVMFGVVLGSENSLPEFEEMQVPKLRSEASVQVVRSLGEAYELIYKAITDPKIGILIPSH